MLPELPIFPFHRDPVSSDSVHESNEACGCCGKVRGVLYSGVTYASDNPENLCPWCIADGSALEKYDAMFFDADFVDDEYNIVSIPLELHREVFGKTIGFSTFNPIGWWVHCGEPAEYIKRNEPYDMVFECRKCHKQQVIEDLD